MGGVHTQSHLKIPRHDYLDQFTVLFLDVGYEFSTRSNSNWDVKFNYQ